MRIFLVALLLTAVAGAQGPIQGADVIPYGQGCPGAGSTPPVLKAGFAAGPPAVLAVEIDNIRWWPNVYFGGWILVAGASPLTLPVLRPGCTLLVAPLALAAYGAAQTRVELPIPPDPALLGVPVFLQGAAQFFGFYFGPDLTGGLKVVFK